MYIMVIFQESKNFLDNENFITLKLKTRELIAKNVYKKLLVLNQKQ